MFLYTILFAVSHIFLFSIGFNNSQNFYGTVENLSVSDSLNFTRLDFIVPDSEPSEQAVILSTNCTFAFENFLDVAVNFTRCTVKYARPIHICMECIDEYRLMQKAYNSLKLQGTECSDFFFGSDQLGIIDIVYSSGNDLWEKSYCQDCFDHLNETEKFFQAFSELLKCIDLSNTSTVLDPNNTCVECQYVYSNVTDIYNIFVASKNEFDPSICMDIVDTMNISRRIWSRYNCMVVFDTNIGFLNVLTTLTVGATPVMFYLLAKNISRLEDVKLVRPKRKFKTVVTPPNQ